MSKKAIIKILDEVNAAIIGLDTSTNKFLYDKFGIFATNYIFQPKYKLGRWDGKIRFYSPAGATYVQLLDEIIPILKRFGFELDLIDNRKPFSINIPSIDNTYLNEYTGPDGNPLILGDHQVIAINAATASNAGIILAATGAGKTVMSAVLCKLYKTYCDYRIIIIVPTSDLVTQTRNGLITYGVDTGEYSGTEKDINHDHVVSTWQALQNNKQLVAMFQGVIVDECHGVKGQVIREIINGAGGNIPVKLGLTGTLPPEECEAMNIRISLGNVLHTVPARELIDKGWLAQLKLKIIQLREELYPQWEEFKIAYPVEASKTTYKKFRTKFFPDYNSERAYIKGKEERNQFIADIIELARPRGNCLVLTNGIPYGRKLANLIPNAYFVHGKDEKEVRRQIYDLFQTQNDVVVVTSYQLASTGLDIPRIFNLFLIDAGNSFVRVIQSIGRGLRKAADKDTVYVYDICSDFSYGKDHMSDRVKYYKEQQYDYTFDTIDYINT